MKKFTIAAAALMATSAFAGDHSINLQGRMGWINTNRDQAKTGLPSDSRIQAEVLDLLFTGKLTSNTTYQVGLNLAASSDATVTGDDATSKYIDTIYITRTLADGLTLDIGKRNLLGGGFEVTHGTVDQYAKSNYWTTVDNTGPQFGATLSKVFGGHTVMAQLSNGNLTRTSGGTGSDNVSQSKYGYAAEWLASWSDMVKTNVGYTVVPVWKPTATPNPVTKDTTLLGAGLQLNVAKFVVEADYGIVTAKKELNSSVTDAKTTSIVGSVAWTGMENLTPFAKFMVDTKKDGDVASHYGDKSETVTSFGLGVEYKESAKDAIRYHAVYTSAKHKYESWKNSTDYTASQIFLGAKIDVNVL